MVNLNLIKKINRNWRKCERMEQMIILWIYREILIRNSWGVYTIIDYNVLLILELVNCLQVTNLQLTLAVAHKFVINTKQTWFCCLFFRWLNQQFLWRNYKSRREKTLILLHQLKGFDYTYGSREGGFEIIQSEKKAGKFC